MLFLLATMYVSSSLVRSLNSLMIQLQRAIIICPKIVTGSTLGLSPQVRSLFSLGLVWLAQLAYVLATAEGLSPGYQEVSQITE